MYFQRQKTHESCRFDAINNYIQANTLNLRSATRLFEEFKKSKPFAHFKLTHNDEQENFLTFVLENLTGRKHRIVDSEVRESLIKKNLSFFKSDISKQSFLKSVTLKINNFKSHSFIKSAILN